MFSESKTAGSVINKRRVPRASIGANQSYFLRGSILDLSALVTQISAFLRPEAPFRV